METEVENLEHEEAVKKILFGFLERRLTVSCRMDREGKLVCKLTALIDTPYGKPRESWVGIPKMMQGDNGYIRAVVETGARKLLSSF